ncbi:Trichodiene synthase [Sparassis latifolia]
MLLSLCRHTICGFLHRVKFTVVPYTHDPELVSQVNNIVQTWDTAVALRPHVVTAVGGTIAAYSHITNIETKVQIALFTTIILALDDPDILDSVPSREFHHMLFSRMAESGSGLLGELRRLLPGMWDHYSRFAASAIVTSALDFMNMTILENETREMSLSSEGAAFLVHRRMRTATAEAYAHFIWAKAKFPDVKVYLQAIPDVMVYVNCVNDILSFYKEELAGETGNYIGDRAAIERRTSMEILQEIVDETVATAERIWHILGEGDARESWESFARGYISAHTLTPRYRLHEVLDRQYLSH